MIKQMSAIKITNKLLTARTLSYRAVKTTNLSRGRLLLVRASLKAKNHQDNRIKLKMILKVHMNKMHDSRN